MIYKFIIKYKNYLMLLLLATLLSYLYFILTCEMSLDNELGIFGYGDGLARFSMSVWFTKIGRPVLGLASYLLSDPVLPYFNTLIPILLIYTAAIIFLITFNRLKALSSYDFILISLYILSPIYLFQFIYINQSVFIGLGLLLMALSLYLISGIVINQNYQIKSIIFVIVMVACATGIYQVFILYFIALIMTLILYIKFLNLNITLNIRSYILVFFIISLSLLVYILMSQVGYLFVGGKSNYTDTYINWGKFHWKIIFELLRYYIYNITLYNFNIGFFITSILAIGLSLFLLFKRYFFCFIVLILLYFSNFGPSILGGSAMPVRVMLFIPFFCFVIFKILLDSLNSQVFKKILSIMAIFLAIVNFRYMTVITYSLHMTLLYDQHQANNIYDRLSEKFPDSLNSKPLVFVGDLPVYREPFIITSTYDNALGYSFFHNLGDNYHARTYYFMKWLGNDYIFPNAQQIVSAEKSAVLMPVFPDNDSMLEESNFIILKLSNGLINSDQINESIPLNINNYQQISESETHYNVEHLASDNKFIKYDGYAYIKNFNAQNTRVVIRFASTNATYSFLTNQVNRGDLAWRLHDAYNVDYARFRGRIPRKWLKNGTYSTELFLVNKNHVAQINMPLKLTVAH